MRITLLERGPVDVLEISGPTTDVEGAGRLREQVKRLIDAGDPVFIVDMTELEMLDSAFLGEVVACRERVRKQDGVIKLVLSGGPHDLFVAAGLDSLFEIFPDQSAAMASIDADSMTAGIP